MLTICTECDKIIQLDKNEKKVYACNMGRRFYKPPLMVDYRLLKPQAAVFFASDTEDV